MSNTLKNIAIILGVSTLAFGGYYFYTQYSSTQFDVAANEQDMQKMLNDTQVFIERGRVLNQITINLDFFGNSRFLSLRSFSTKIEERPVGRLDPFADVESVDGGSNF